MSTLLSEVSGPARLPAEVERCVRYRRPLAIAILLSPTDVSAAKVKRIAAGLRLPDEVHLLRPREVLMLLPETTDKAAIPVQRALRVLGPKARAGVAHCPVDGSDAATLEEAARQAALGAALGGFALARSASFTVTVGGKTIVAADVATKELLGLLRALARSTIPVLLVGETGVGKEVAALAVHDWSPRRTGPYLAVNCAAFAESLLESELFGHEKGAFSGADRARPGLLEAATGGTLLLDEISEAAPRVQAELLRVIETQRVRRLGSVEETPIDVRLVAATNRPVERDLASGRLRADLYYRLGAAAVRVPPLRERPADIAPLFDLFMAQACLRLGRRVPRLSEGAAGLLLAYGFPGNVRELRQLVEYLCAVVEGDDILAGHVAPRLVAVAPPPPSPAPRETEASGPLVPLAEEVRQLETRRIRQALEACGGVRNQAAVALGMPLRTFVAKLRRYGLGDIPSSRRRRT